jgi:hypothetical protein
VKQLELFKPYELDPNRSYERFMWQKGGQQTIYWPTQQQWDDMSENREESSDKKHLTESKSVL